MHEVPSVVLIVADMSQLVVTQSIVELIDGWARE